MPGFAHLRFVFKVDPKWRNQSRAYRVEEPPFFLLRSGVFSTKVIVVEDVRLDSTVVFRTRGFRTSIELQKIIRLGHLLL